jgi:hypothetical protein
VESDQRRGKTPNILGFNFVERERLPDGGEVVFSIKLAEPAPELTAYAPMAPHLALSQCGRVKRTPLIPTMRNILKGTRHTIELFVGEFDTFAKNSL